MHCRQRMLTRAMGLLALIGVLVAASLSVGVGRARADEPVVRAVFFWAETCPYCHEVMEEVLPPLEEEYGAQLEIAKLELSEVPKNYEVWLEALESYEVPENRRGVPMLFIGDTVLVGSREIPEQLPGLIEQHLAVGGVGYPDVPGLEDVLEETAPSQEVDRTPAPDATPSKEANETPVHVAYFYQAGCQECDQVQLALNYLQDQYPQLSVCTLDVREEAPLAERLGEKAGVPVGKRLTAPAIFVGDDALVGDELHATSLEELLDRYAETGAEPLCVGSEAASDETASSIIERFRSFSLATVLVAGLVDGLNPCAFATLVFFISYLTFMGREGRQVLLAGGAFAAAVFLTYLGVGFGVLKFLATLPFLDAVSRWIYGFTAVLCLVLAAGSLYDWWQARRGKAKDMRLAMPTWLRRRVNQAIRERAGAKAFVPVTFVTGVVVSVIELACTGQVYLPTILFVLGVPEMQAQAGFYLVLYNLMFILPLVVVFVLAYFGTTSQQLGLLIHRHTAKVKLATAALFLLLAGWMVVTLV